MPSGISIIVPTLNEAANIDPLLKAIFEQEGHGLRIEVIVVDDRSADGTPERVRAWEKSHAVRLLSREQPAGGLAGAVLAGARVASHEAVLVMDADGSHPPEAIPALVAPVLAGESEMVIGSRYAAGGSTPGWPLFRRIASRLAAALAWPMADVHDALSGFFATRRERLLAIEPGAAGFKIALELLVRGGEVLRAREVPIVFRDRARGESKMSARVLLMYVRRLFALAGASGGSWALSSFGKALLVFTADLAAFLALCAWSVPPQTAHIGSFALAAAVGAGFLVRRLAGWRAWARFSGIGAMALFLRGGVLALGMHEWGWSAPVAMLPAIAAGIAVQWLGTIFFTSPALPRYAKGIGWRIAAGGVVAYLAVVRLVFLCAPNLMPEEAYYWNYGQHLALGYLDHPPMVAWLTRLGTELFGHAEFGVRIGAFACWLAASFFVFRLARDLFEKTAAFVALLLFQALPFFFSVGLLLTPDAPLVACWAAALFYLQRALLGGEKRGWLALGVALGLGMISKYSIALVGASALVFLVADRPSRRWFLRPEPYLAVLIAAALFSPVIIWNAQNDWASFAFQSSRRLSASAEFSLHKLLGSVLLLLTPVGAAAAAVALLRPLGGEGERAALRAKFIRVFTLTPLAVFVFFSLTHRVQLNWNGPLWLAALPAIAAGLVALARAPLPGPWEGRLRAAWTPTILGTTILYAGLLHYLSLGLPGVGYSGRIELMPAGWADLGRQVEALEDELTRETGREPLVIGMDRYFIASQLAFYRPDRHEAVEQTGGRHLFGGVSLMYERWFPREAQAGKDLLLVALEEEQLGDGKVGKRAARLGPVREAVLFAHGKPVRRFFHRTVYGYGEKRAALPAAGAPAELLDLPQRAGERTARRDEALRREPAVL